MSNIQYTTIDRVLARVQKYIEMSGLGEADVIELAGQALDLLKTSQLQVETVSFLKVENYEAKLPDGFQLVLQVARYEGEDDDTDCEVKEIEEIEEEVLTDPDKCGDCGFIDYLCSGFNKEYRPYFDMQWQYIDWTTSRYYKKNFTPVRLANHTFFTSLVCREKDSYSEFIDSSINSDCNIDQYTIVGTLEKKLRFSFEEGHIALSYLRSALDPKTGYPLVPDHEQHLSAIQYYILWKLAEFLDWNGREGYAGKAERYMQLWLKYVSQAKNFSKMPKSLDEFQNILDQSHYLIPRRNRYYGYFGKLSSPEQRRFGDPMNRNIR